MTLELMGAIMGAISGKNHLKRGKRVLNLPMEENGKA